MATLNETDDYFLGDIDLAVLPIFSQKSDDTIDISQETIECVNDLISEPVV